MFYQTVVIRYLTYLTKDVHFKLLFLRRLKNTSAIYLHEKFVVSSLSPIPAFLMRAIEPKAVKQKSEKLTGLGSPIQFLSNH